MKKLVFQYYFKEKLFLDERDDIGKDILPYSMKSVMAYAQKIEADYKLCTNRNFPHLSIQCEKLRVLEEKDYDKILVVDTDVIIPQSITINIFNEYRDAKLALRGSPPPLRFMSSINSGVVIWDKEIINLLQEDYKELFDKNFHRRSFKVWHDENFIQECWVKHDFEITPLDKKWNCNGEEFHDWNHKANFIHYGADERARLVFKEEYWKDKL